MNYKFVYISTDNYELRYTDREGIKKVLPFKRTIEMSKKLQGIQAMGRLKMFQELTAQGMTKKDLIVKKVNEDGSITYDETNYKEYEKSYIELASVMILNEVIKLCFNMNVDELMTEIGIDLQDSSSENIKKITLFTQQFTKVITGDDDLNTPSVDNKESIPGDDTKA